MSFESEALSVETLLRLEAANNNYTLECDLNLEQHRVELTRFFMDEFIGTLTTLALLRYDKEHRPWGNIFCTLQDIEERQACCTKRLDAMSKCFLTTFAIPYIQEKIKSLYDQPNSEMKHYQLQQLKSYLKTISKEY